MSTLQDTRLLDDAQALIRLRSENPPGGDVAPAEYVAERLRSLGAEVTVQRYAENRANAVGVLRFGGGPTLLFNSHVDVVPAQADEQFAPVVRDDRLIGRGACDAKGPVAAMLAACERLAANPPRVGTVVLAAVADEEVHGSGSEHLVRPGGVRADAAVIGEPTENHVHLGCRGSYRAKVRFHGRAAHSSDPTLGQNAITDAARFVLAVDDWLRDVAARPARGVVSATIIAGGAKVNIVPDTCDVFVDRRLGPGETAADGEAELRERLGRLQAQYPALRWTVDQLEESKPSVYLPPEHPFARLALDLAGKGEGRFFRGGTDAPFLDAAGIPSVIYGPGSLDQAHAVDEWVPIPALYEAAVYYERLARAYLEGV